VDGAREGAGFAVGDAVAEGEEGKEDGALPRRRLVEALLEAAGELLPDAGDEGGELGALVAEVVAEAAAVGVDEGAAGGDGDVFFDALVHVPGGQDREHLAAGMQVEGREGAVDVGADVAVAEHHALGRAGGAARVDDGEEVVGAEGGAGLVEELGAFAAGEEFAAAGGELGEGGVRGAAGGFAAHDVQAELGEMFAQGGGRV
jgi:hypothetical protein